MPEPLPPELAPELLPELDPLLDPDPLPEPLPLLDPELLPEPDPEPLPELDPELLPLSLASAASAPASGAWQAWPWHVSPAAAQSRHGPPGAPHSWSDVPGWQTSFASMHPVHVVQTPATQVLPLAWPQKAHAAPPVPHV